MMFKTPSQFDEFCNEVFNGIRFDTLSNISKNRVRLDLGEVFNNELKAQMAYEKVIKIFNSIFYGRDVWIRMILWDTSYKVEKRIENEWDTHIQFAVSNEDCYVLYFHLPSLMNSLADYLIRCLINFDLGLEPSLNSTCFFFNFDTSTVVNLYDDRGMDVVSQDKTIVEMLLMLNRSSLN